uniref:Uncharacterized protein n=2 Tax=Anguilla anguilla TaxID=7936 RepID=A0A0E9TMS7_ANGAN
MQAVFKEKMSFSEKYNLSEKAYHGKSFTS